MREKREKREIGKGERGEKERDREIERDITKMDEAVM